jgi:hypothetical protein
MASTTAQPRGHGPAHGIPLEEHGHSRVSRQLACAHANGCWWAHFRACSVDRVAWGVLDEKRELAKQGADSSVLVLELAVWEGYFAILKMLGRIRARRLGEFLCFKRTACGRHMDGMDRCTRRIGSRIGTALEGSRHRQRFPIKILVPAERQQAAAHLRSALCLIPTSSQQLTYIHATVVLYMSESRRSESQRI